MISFVYFDVGGVVMKDFTGSTKWEDFEKELGVPTNQESDFTKFWDSYEPELCRGRNVETLLPLLKKHFNVNVPSTYSLLCDGFVNRFEENRSIWPVIQEVQKTHRTGLLTNMYPGMLDALHKRKLLDDFTWDIVIDSSVVGFQKPDKEIYEVAEKQAGVSSNQILFIDNSAKNVEAAKEAGWQTFHYDATHQKEASEELLKFWKSIPKN